MNQYQKLCAETYGDGEFAWMAAERGDGDRWREWVSACGDTLFAAIMIELSTKEGCDSDREAVRRLIAMNRDVGTVLANVGRMH